MKSPLWQTTVVDGFFQPLTGHRRKPISLDSASQKAVSQGFRFFGLLFDLRSGNNRRLADPERGMHDCDDSNPGGQTAEKPLALASRNRWPASTGPGPPDDSALVGPAQHQFFDLPGASR